MSVCYSIPVIISSHFITIIPVIVDPSFFHLESSTWLIVNIDCFLRERLHCYKYHVLYFDGNNTCLTTHIYIYTCYSCLSVHSFPVLYSTQFLEQLWITMSQGWFLTHWGLAKELGVPWVLHMLNHFFFTFLFLFIRFKWLTGSFYVVLFVCNYMYKLAEVPISSE